MWSNVDLYEPAKKEWSSGFKMGDDERERFQTVKVRELQDSIALSLPVITYNTKAQHTTTFINRIYKFYNSKPSL